jgi:hypothetical protein
MSQLGSASDGLQKDLPISAAGGSCSAAGTAARRRSDLLLGSFAETSLAGFDSAQPPPDRERREPQ